MKKTIALLLILALMIPAGAWACTESAVTIEQSETISAILTIKTETETTLTFTDTIYLPTTESHTIAGIKDESEPVRCIGLQSVCGKFVSGKLDNGWAKASFADDGAGENVAVLVIECNGELLGLTGYDNVILTVFEPYGPFVLAVLQDLFGPDVTMCNGTLGAAMLWFTGNHASLIFFPSYSDAFQIGTAQLNAGDDVTPLMAGHFGGQYHLGLKCGWWEPEPETHVWIDTNVTAEAQANAEAVAAAQVSAQAAAVSVSNSGSINQSGDGCYRNNTVIQINLGIVQTVKNCIKLLKECAQ